MASLAATAPTACRFEGVRRALNAVKTKASDATSAVSTRTTGLITPRTYMGSRTIECLKNTVENGNWFTARASFLLRTVEFVAVAAFEEVSALVNLAALFIHSLCNWSFSEMKEEFKTTTMNALLIPVHATASVVIGAVGILFPSVHLVYSVDSTQTSAARSSLEAAADVVSSASDDVLESSAAAASSTAAAADASALGEEAVVDGPAKRTRSSTTTTRLAVDASQPSAVKGASKKKTPATVPEEN